MQSKTTMTRLEVEQLRQRILRLFFERMQALEAARERALLATDDLLLSLQDDDDEINFPLLQQKPDSMTLMDAVRFIVFNYAGDFDINRIREIIESEYPGVKKPLNPTSISNSLKRLHKDKILERPFEGSGKIPAIYRLSPAHKPTATTAPQEEDFDNSFPPE